MLPSFSGDVSGTGSHSSGGNTSSAAAGAKSVSVPASPSKEGQRTQSQTRDTSTTSIANQAGPNTQAQPTQGTGSLSQSREGARSAESSSSTAARSGPMASWPTQEALDSQARRDLNDAKMSTQMNAQATAQQGQTRKEQDKSPIKSSVLMRQESQTEIPAHARTGNLESSLTTGKESLNAASSLDTSFGCILNFKVRVCAYVFRVSCACGRVEYKYSDDRSRLFRIGLMPLYLTATTTLGSCPIVRVCAYLKPCVSVCLILSA